MLVLSVERDGKVFIGDEIEVTLVDIRGDKARIGFTAPEKIKIDREKVRERKLAETRS